MSLLSTLRPSSTRLLYFLSLFLVPSPVSVPLTLGTLDDDCLLLLFSFLSVPKLLTLRGVSRRFAYLIERYTLPKWRTLLYGYSEAERTQRGNHYYSSKPQIVDLFFSRSVHPYTDFCRNFNVFGPLHEPFYRQPRQVHRAVLSSLPASLPRLLPNLSCLTFSCFFGDDNSPSCFKLKEECLKVNHLLSVYLQSSWATTLVSLHLYLEMTIIPYPVNGPFPLAPLSQLVALRHLFLQLCPWSRYGHNAFPLLPDILPVLGQLISFGLHSYSGSNAPLLLAQLGPHLESLSLNQVTCSVADFGAFLRAKATYRRTLRTLEIYLKGDFPLGLELPAAFQCLPSLERLYIPFFFKGSLRERLFNLCRLPELRELSTFGMSLHELRALRDNYPREGFPRLASIRILHCHIDNWPHPVVDFTSEELFNTFLPLLSRTFCRVEHLTINCERSLFDYQNGLEELAAKAKESFPHLLSC